MNADRWVLVKVSYSRHMSFVYHELAADETPLCGAALQLDNWTIVPVARVHRTHRSLCRHCFKRLQQEAQSMNATVPPGTEPGEDLPTGIPGDEPTGDPPPDAR